MLNAQCNILHVAGYSEGTLCLDNPFPLRPPDHRFHNAAFAALLDDRDKGEGVTVTRERKFPRVGIESVTCRVEIHYYMWDYIVIFTNKSDVLPIVNRKIGINPFTIQTKIIHECVLADKK